MVTKVSIQKVGAPDSGKSEKNCDRINDRYLRAPLEFDKVFGCVEKPVTSSVDLACLFT